MRRIHDEIERIRFSHWFNDRHVGMCDQAVRLVGDVVSHFRLARISVREIPGDPEGSLEDLPVAVRRLRVVDQTRPEGSRRVFFVIALRSAISYMPPAMGHAILL